MCEHGHWIIFSDDDPDLSCFKCSVCGEYFLIDDCLSDHCPNCGARMDGD